MAMNGNTLGDAMKAAIDGEPGFKEAPHAGETMAAYRTRIFRAQGGAIVAHITANGVISVSTTVALGIVVATPDTLTGTTTGTGTGTDNAGTIA